uniref:Nucleolin-like n=1 Tax=Neolamprologus brichardi TaxID=32507 RepID=A0A3Q4G8X0_NEOBR
MAKTDATRRRKKQSKVVQEDTADTDRQTDTVIKVKGNAPTVTVSWKKKNEEGEDDDTQTTLDASDQMTGCVNGKQKAVKNRPSKKSKVNNDGFRICVGNLNKTKTYQEVNESLEKYFMSQSLLFQDIQLDQSRKHAFVDLATEMDLTKALALNGEILLDKPMKITKVKITSEDKAKVNASSLDKKVNGKRKAEPVIEDSPSKKAKHINEGFCLFVGNLNSSKNSEELKESLEKYLMSQNLLFKDIRLDQSRKHAFVDLLSEMDLTKALTSNGEVLLDKPMEIAKAKIKSAEKVKVKSPELKKQGKNDQIDLFNVC